MGFLVQIPTDSTSGERFTIGVGLSDTPNQPGLTSANSILIRYCDNVNGGRWLGVCGEGTESTADLGVSPETNAWQFVEIEVFPDISRVNFYVGGVLQNHVLNDIPASLLRPFIGIKKSVGTTSRKIYFDACYIMAEFDLNRA